MSIPYADAATQDTITDAQAKFFHEKGFLVVKNILKPEELEYLRKETLNIIEQRNVGPDFWYNDDIPSDWYNNYKENGNKEDNKDGNPAVPENNNNEGERKRGVPFRVEYVVDKMESCRHLIAHPFLLSAIARIQGPNFLPTWDSLVFKYESDGVPIKWHRDASADSIGNLVVEIILIESILLLTFFCFFSGGGFYNYGSTKPKEGIYHPPIDAGISE